MTPEEATQVADQVLFAHTGSSLTDIQRMILRESLDGKGYEQMEGYAPQHIKNEGKKLWDLLSEALGEKVGKTSFRGALERRLKSRNIMPTPPMPSTYDGQTWVGRESWVTELLPKLQGQTRLLWITGISGIGKTTLGECLVSKAWERDPTFQWIYLEMLEGQSPDFPSVAADLLAKLGEPDLGPQERNNPDQLAKRLLQRLQSHPYWIQLDALERLLNPEQPNEFVDPYWATFLQRCLTDSPFASRLVLTSQAFPKALIEFGDRYPNAWRKIRLDGLLQVEQQLEFFAKRGISVEPANQDILARIGKIYEGHPLVLKVIAEDILQDFAGDVVRYWQVYQPEFEQVARELQAARLNETEYNEALDRKVRDRIKKSLEQLPTDALDLLCRSSVFRRPVPKKFWLTMIGDRTPQQQKAAYRVLGDRALVEKEGIDIRQHNLIRDIADDLLREDTFTWEAAERRAAKLWLTAYEPAPSTSNLEKFRGYLEAFYHFHEIENWIEAENILQGRVDTSTQKTLLEYLYHCGYYQEIVNLNLCRGLLPKLNNQKQGSILNLLGDTYRIVGKIEEAINCAERSVSIWQNLENRAGLGRALSSLIKANYIKGDKSQTVTLLQQCLIFAKQVNDFEGQSMALLYLGDSYKEDGCFQVARKQYISSFELAERTNNIRDQGMALCRWGSILIQEESFLKARCVLEKSLKLFENDEIISGQAESFLRLAELHQKLGETDRALEYCDRALELAIELRIPLVKECEELKQQLKEEHNGGNG